MLSNGNCSCIGNDADCWEGVVSIELCGLGTGAGIFSRAGSVALFDIGSKGSKFMDGSRYRAGS